MLPLTVIRFLVQPRATASSSAYSGTNAGNCCNLCTRFGAARERALWQVWRLGKARCVGG